MHNKESIEKLVDEVGCYNVLEYSSEGIYDYYHTDGVELYRDALGSALSHSSYTFIDNYDIVSFVRKYFS